LCSAPIPRLAPSTLYSCGHQWSDIVTTIIITIIVIILIIITASSSNDTH